MARLFNHRGKAYRRLKARHPLMSWDVISMAVRQPQTPEFQSLFRMKASFQWEFDLDSYLHTTFDAIVVTDTDQRIVWASKGFEQMTGYSALEALDRRPTFLQGPSTSRLIKRQMGQDIAMRQKTEGTLINYRKNGEAYLCNLKILPISNRNNEVTHFIALEKEVFAR